MTEHVRIRVDGVVVPDDTLAQLAMVNYGHFTAMQIRSGQVRGLTKHINRLQLSHTELFGTTIDPATIVNHIQQATLGTPDSYLRVTLFETDPGVVRIMTVLRDPVDPPSAAVSVVPVVYQRPVAHIKHVGSFGQLYCGRLARNQGFDDALLTTPDGEVSETSIANIGFIDSNERIIWPSAPSLHGITWQLLDEALEGTATKVRRRPVMLDEVSGFVGAFVANSVGVAPVRKIGGLASYDATAARDVVKLYEAISWDNI
ncbi:aminotransferase class IV [Arthrobacter sp. yr096]|uniref:aminotransferase class IV n=1 Tax=Arthrobacter sp. yr096 TaxID=1761750 RepID=UPI0015A5DC37|nr:aminotransferase class IV [Arthrobacter sp. yr096]